ncbi:hypothetical protein ES703_50259 [subsurface metagenome]
MSCFTVAVRLLSKVVRNILRLFTSKTIEELETPAESVKELEVQPLPGRKPPRKWWEFPVRLVRTSRGGPNMPKYQPCPQCRARSKRQSKTLGGANYRCVKHGVFFVKLARLSEELG